MCGGAGYSLLLLATVIFSSAYSLLCFTRPCRSSEDNLCIQRCPSPEYSSCYKELAVYGDGPNEGAHVVTLASCSTINDGCTTEADRCDFNLKYAPDENYLRLNRSCCCTTDYCNGFFAEAGKLYPSLSVSRFLPVIPPPLELPMSTPPSDQENVTTDHLVCEAYYCADDNWYPDCFHFSIKCPSKYHVCKSEYKFTAEGLLVPSFKGCATVLGNNPVERDGCHIDNPLLPSEETFFCFCTGNYCNQNNTFTYVTSLASYGREECEAKHCEHSCRVVNNAPQCQCARGYRLLGDGISCKDINECERSNGGCPQICLNTEGSFECACLDGFVFDPIYNSCESEHGIFCYNSVCFSTEAVCKPPVSFHCSNDDLYQPDENILSLQYCFSYYTYYYKEDRWRPFYDKCAVARYGENVECLDNKKCVLEVYENKTDFTRYYCCCRGNNCNGPVVFPGIVSTTTSISFILATTNDTFLPTSPVVYYNTVDSSFPAVSSLLIVGVDQVTYAGVAVCVILVVVLCLLVFIGLIVHIKKVKQIKARKPAAFPLQQIDVLEKEDRTTDLGHFILFAHSYGTNLQAIIMKENQEEDQPSSDEEDDQPSSDKKVGPIQVEALVHPVQGEDNCEQDNAIREELELEPRVQDTIRIQDFKTSAV